MRSLATAGAAVAQGVQSTDQALQDLRAQHAAQGAAQQQAQAQTIQMLQQLLQQQQQQAVAG